MKKMKVIAFFLLAFGALSTQAADKALNEKAEFDVKNVECSLRYRSESMSQAEDVKMVKADIDGMIPISGAHLASFKKDDVVYQALASGVRKLDNVILVGVEVAVTNTKEGSVADQMLKGSIALSSDQAYGFITTSKDQLDGKKIKSTLVAVICSIPALTQK